MESKIDKTLGIFQHSRFLLHSNHIMTNDNILEINNEIFFQSGQILQCGNVGKNLGRSKGRVDFTLLGNSVKKNGRSLRYGILERTKWNNEQ